MKWLRYSGIWVSLAINPLHWRIACEVSGPTDMDPAMYSGYVSMGPLTIRIVIDDGSY